MRARTSLHSRSSSFVNITRSFLNVKRGAFSLPTQEVTRLSFPARVQFHPPTLSAPRCAQTQVSTSGNLFLPFMRRLCRSNCGRSLPSSAQFRTGGCLVGLDCAHRGSTFLARGLCEHRDRRGNLGVLALS